MLVATCATPQGILTAINSFAIMNNQNGGKANVTPTTTISTTPDPTLLARAGLNSTQWSSLVTALGAVSSSQLLALLNAAGVMLCIEQQPFPIAGSTEGGSISQPVGGRVLSVFGDLS